MIRFAMLSFVVFCSLGLSSVSHADQNQCVSKSPKVDCIEHMYSKTTLDRIGAAKVCSNGVTVECVEYMYSKTTLDRIGAAAACRGE